MSEPSLVRLPSLVLLVLDLVKVVHGTRVASPWHPVLAHGGKHHAHLKALLEAAVLASVPLGFVDLTVVVGHTRVHTLVLHSALEEAFASERGGHDSRLYKRLDVQLFSNYFRN